jgi:hypothetical protein
MESYEERQQAYLAFCAPHTQSGRTGFFSQIARLELEQDAVEEAPIREAIAFADSRADCGDFSISGLLRILYLYRNSAFISKSLLEDIEACVLRFKYWWDQPGEGRWWDQPGEGRWWDQPGEGRFCYHTENHQIIFHACELLVGQLFKDRTFENSQQDGTYHIAHARPLIERWLDFRVQFGFSEWLSNCYFDHDLMALVNLFDFAEDDTISKRAGLLIDVLLFEMSLHTHRGVFGSTHGRTYPRLIKNGRQESTASICKLAFGMGEHHSPSSLGAVALATSTYRPSTIFEQIAKDLETPICCKERHSLNIDDALKHGLSYDQFEDGHLYWSIQEYAHPKVLPLSQKMTETFGVRSYGNYQMYVDAYEKQIADHGKIVDPHLDCHAMTEVHIETYRTADYLLSCAQDYRPGSPGYQQHIWQATLGIDTMVFTNHPGSDNETSRPNYWAGNGLMPRTVQFRNVLICVHRVPKDNAFPFSHAYFPRAGFDEIVENDHWIFGRKGDGYIAVFSQSSVRWVGDEELRVDTPENIWMCEMGHKEQWGNFEMFINQIQTSTIHSEGLNIRYVSPSQGEMTFGWHTHFKVNGTAIPLHTGKRFDNPYCQCDFLEKQIVIQNGDNKVVLDFERNERITQELAQGSE